MNGNVLNEKFEKIKKFLIKIENNVDKNYFEFEIGLPEKWYYKSNDFICCENLKKIDNYGTIVKIYPKKQDIRVDDIFNFIIKTIEINNRIAEMEKAFQEKMESEKEKIKNEVEKFYSKIEDLRVKSFENLDDDENIEDNLQKIQNIRETYDHLNANEEKDLYPSGNTFPSTVSSKIDNDLKNIDDIKTNINNLGDNKEQKSLNNKSKK